MTNSSPATPDSPPPPTRDWLKILRGFLPFSAGREANEETSEPPTQEPAPAAQDWEAGFADAPLTIRAFLPEGLGLSSEAGPAASAEGTSEKEVSEQKIVLPSAMMVKMADALQAHAALAERYARAGYQIGKLEAEVKTLRMERQTLQVKLLETEQHLADSRLNEQVLKAEREHALAELQAALLRLAATGEQKPGGLAAVRQFLRRHW